MYHSKYKKYKERYLSLVQQQREQQMGGHVNDQQLERYYKYKAKKYRKKYKDLVAGGEEQDHNYTALKNSLANQEAMASWTQSQEKQRQGLIGKYIRITENPEAEDKKWAWQRLGGYNYAWKPDNVYKVVKFRPSMFPSLNLKKLRKSEHFIELIRYDNNQVPTEKTPGNPFSPIYKVVLDRNQNGGLKYTLARDYESTGRVHFPDEPLMAEDSK